MKKLLISVLLLLIVGIIPAVGAQEPSPVFCGTPTVVTLYAGQTINAGTVTVSNDADNLYVTYSTNDPWLVSETHLHVADTLANIPQTRNGNPKVGNFAYQRAYNPPVTEDTYVIPKSDLTFDGTDGLVIAAHAVVVQLDDYGNVIANETGWGDGDRFTDRGSWATYIQYTWQPCDEPPPSGSGTETAFAYGADHATCFLDLGLGINRWGWTNGPLSPASYTFDIYAGAGQCDLNKGTFVGTLTVVYDGSTAMVTFNMVGTNPDTGLPYTLEETHLYVGSEILARDVNGDFTVAPGQYPTIHDLDGATTDSYMITGLSGDIYVVAHATVAGFPAS